MRHFRPGDYVQVAGLPSSQWQNRQGTIVEILEHGSYEQGEISQECAVDIGGERHWFMAEHLVKTVPPSLSLKTHCEEKRALMTAYQKAVTAYSVAVAELSRAVGAALYAEYELIHRKVVALQKLSDEAYSQLQDHRERHNC